jgi:electron transfer flavoprotein alpha subunit
MAILVFVESADQVIKKSSLEAVCYAKAMGGDVTAIVLGEISSDQLEDLGKYGASKVLHVNDAKLNQSIIQAYASVIAQAMEKEGADTLVLAKSSLGDPVAAIVSIKMDASLASNVVDLPDTSNGFKVKRSIYTGKAFAVVEMKSDTKIIAIKKNAIEAKEGSGSATVEAFEPSLSDSDFSAKIVSQDKATGDILLPEADIVVSGGRGLKGPENWGMIEDLAKALGAATVSLYQTWTGDLIMST